MTTYIILGDHGECISIKAPSESEALDQVEGMNSEDMVILDLSEAKQLIKTLTRVTKA